jgi:UDP-N-acetylglucosamine 2-epimerase (non-hydrolysing)
VIDVFIGTKAQYIKTAPLLRLMTEQGLDYRLIDSGQHAAFAPPLRRSLGVKEPDICLANDGDIASVPAALFWMIKLMLTALFRPGYLRDEVFSVDSSYCVIHGDTPSTLIALLMAKRAGKRVAHLESGLRSYRWYHPFPEEMIRQLCARYCDLLFAPSDWAEENLRKMKVRGKIINIGQNTNVEAIHYSLEQAADSPDNGPPYALITLHRVETILSRSRLAFATSLIQELASERRVIFVLHPPTKRKLQDFGLMQTLSGLQNVQLEHLMDHGSFLVLLRDAEFVITDGGSIQEEAYYLDTPCLVLRSETERQEGLGGNAVMGHFDKNVIENFLQHYERYRSWQAISSKLPSKTVLDTLRKEQE